MVDISKSVRELKIQIKPNDNDGKEALVTIIKRLAEAELRLIKQRTNVIDEYIRSYLTLDQLLKLIKKQHLCSTNLNSLRLTVENGHIKLLTSFNVDITIDDEMNMCTIDFDLLASIPLTNELLSTSNIYLFTPVTNKPYQFNWETYKQFTTFKIRAVDCTLTHTQDSTHIQSPVPNTQ